MRRAGSDPDDAESEARGVHGAREELDVAHTMALTAALWCNITALR
jgi:hypothetical protein